MRRLLAICTALAFGLTASTRAGPAVSAEGAPSEYFIKAVYLYNFIKFVEWPGEYALSSRNSINICFLGSNPFGAELKQLEKASKPELQLNLVRDVSDQQIPSCHLLFIGDSEEARITSVLGLVRQYPVLTVSEIGKFAERGGIIEFVRSEKNIGLFTKEQIKLEVNQKAAAAVNLKIDANLLEIAQRVIR